MRQPYFATHAVGLLYFLVVLTWYGAEIIMFFRQLGWRKGATRVAEWGFWLFFAASVVAAITMLILAPSIAPAADIGHPGVAFAVGMVLLVAGVTVRCGRSGRWAGTSPSRSRSAPTSRWWRPARTACCVTRGMRAGCSP